MVSCSDVFRVSIGTIRRGKRRAHADPTEEFGKRSHPAACLRSSPFLQKVGEIGDPFAAQ